MNAYVIRRRSDGAYYVGNHYIWNYSWSNTARPKLYKSSGTCMAALRHVVDKALKHRDRDTYECVSLTLTADPPVAAIETMPNELNVVDV